MSRGDGEVENGNIGIRLTGPRRGCALSSREPREEESDYEMDNGNWSFDIYSSSTNTNIFYLPVGIIYSGNRNGNSANGC